MCSKIVTFCLAICTGILNGACDFEEPVVSEIVCKNSTDLQRIAETIEIQLSDIDYFKSNNYKDLAIVNKANEVVAVQYIDIDQDSVFDRLIFQSNFEPNETKVFKIVNSKDNLKTLKPTSQTFCRIVPERMDDFAWENDRVAFRSYGPECQRLYEEGVNGGLISSGIDVWTKRVDYPIIDKWYEAHLNGISYHEDHGEGLDAYHVGKTRGCGGTALLHNDQYILSKNFTNWKILANGPIRSIFELEYDSVSVDGHMVKEKKRITLDLGSNLFHCKVNYSATNQLSRSAIGIAFHDGNGDFDRDLKKGWFSYWEPYDKSELGTGAIVNPKTLTNIVYDKSYDNEENQNIWALVKLKDNSFEYWAGFGWKKNGKINNENEWKKYLKTESIKKMNPIKVKIIKD